MPPKEKPPPFPQPKAPPKPPGTAYRVTGETHIPSRDGGVLYLAADSVYPLWRLDEFGGIDFLQRSGVVLTEIDPEDPDAGSDHG